MPKRRIEEAAAAKQARIDRGEDVIVGVNKYRLDEHSPIDTLEVDNHAVRDGQIARLSKWPRDPRRGDVPAALTALDRGREDECQPARAGRRGGPRPRLVGRNLRARWKPSFGRYGTQPTPVVGIYGEGLRRGSALRCR